jgi:ribonuclease J
MAALARIAEGTHPLKLEAGDLVVYSSRQIPGNETAIGRVQNALAARGVEVITDRQANVHVSGHPGRPELTAMYEWIRPQIAIPVHGERRHLEEHARLAKSLGVPAAMVPTDGLVIRLGPDGPAKLGHEPVGRLVLDGDVILPADGATMNTRRKLATMGYMAATLVLTPKGALAAEPQVLARGVPVEEDEAEFLEDCVDAAAKEAQRGSKDLEEKVRLALRKVAKRWTGKKPITDVTVVRL